MKAVFQRLEIIVKAALISAAFLLLPPCATAHVLFDVRREAARMADERSADESLADIQSDDSSRIGSMALLDGSRCSKVLASSAVRA